MHVEKTDAALDTVLPLHSVGRRPNNIFKILSLNTIQARILSGASALHRKE